MADERKPPRMRRPTIRRRTRAEQRRVESERSRAYAEFCERPDARPRRLLPPAETPEEIAAVIDSVRRRLTK
jgi:hypothetical protein